MSRGCKRAAAGTARYAGGRLDTPARLVGRSPERASDGRGCEPESASSTPDPDAGPGGRALPRELKRCRSPSGARAIVSTEADAFAGSHQRGWDMSAYPGARGSPVLCTFDGELVAFGPGGAPDRQGVAIYRVACEVN